MMEDPKFCDVLKCSLINLALNGADMVFKDQKLQKISPFTNGIMKGSFLLEGSSIESEESPREDENVPNKMFQEDERVGAKLDNAFLELNNSGVCVNVPQQRVRYPSEGYSDFPYNILNFLALLTTRCVGLQLSVLVSLLTFPIWMSYFSLMFLLFPFQKLRHLRGYMTKKLLRTSMVVASSVSEHVKTQKKLAVRVGWAAFSSMYVCSMLLGLLLSGFVFGGLVMHRLVEKPVQMKESLNFDFTKASPVAFMPLMSSSSIGASSRLIDTYNMRGGARLIPYNHNLQLTVSMTVPESDYNRKLGVFQVKMELLSANGKVTASSSYPCMLKFKSKLIRYVETFLKSAPLIAGFRTESQVLSITMNDFTEELEPTTCLKVTIEQRAEYEHVGGVPQIYAASLALESELPQLNKLIWEWKTTIFVWTSIMAFLTEFMVIIVLFKPIIAPRGEAKEWLQQKAFSFIT